MKSLQKRKYRNRGEFITESIVFQDKLEDGKPDLKSGIVSVKNDKRDLPIFRTPTPVELRAADINSSDYDVAYTMLLTRLMWDFHLIPYHLHSKLITVQFDTSKLMDFVNGNVEKIKTVFKDDEKAWYFRELMLLAKTNQYDRDAPEVNRLFGDKSIVSVLIDKETFLQKGKTDKEDEKIQNELLRQLYREKILYTPPDLRSKDTKKAQDEYIKKIGSVKGRGVGNFQSILKDPTTWEWHKDVVKNGRVDKESLIKRLLERFVGDRIYGQNEELKQAQEYANKTAGVVYKKILEYLPSSNSSSSEPKQSTETKSEENAEIKDSQYPKHVFLSMPSLAAALCRIKERKGNTPQNLHFFDGDGGITSLSVSIAKNDFKCIGPKPEGMVLEPTKANAFFSNVFKNDPEHDKFDFKKSFKEIITLLIPKNTLFDERFDVNRIKDIETKAHIEEMSFLDYWRLINDTAYYYRIDYNVVFDYLQRKELKNRIDNLAIRNAKDEEEEETSTDTETGSDASTITTAQPAKRRGRPPKTAEQKAQDAAKAAQKISPDEANFANRSEEIINQQKKALIQKRSSDLNTYTQDQFIQYIHDVFDCLQLQYIFNFNASYMEDVWNTAVETWRDKTYESAGILIHDRQYTAHKRDNNYVTEIVNDPIGDKLNYRKTYYNEALETIKKSIEADLDEGHKLGEENDYFKQCYNVIRWGKRLGTWLQERIDKGYQPGEIVTAINCANKLDSKLRMGQRLGGWNWFSFNNVFNYFYNQRFKTENETENTDNSGSSGSKKMSVGELKQAINKYSQENWRSGVSIPKGLAVSKNTVVKKLQTIREGIKTDFNSEDFSIQNFIKYIRKHDPEALENFYKYGIDDGHLDYKNLPRYRTSKNDIKIIPWRENDFVTWDSFKTWDDFNNYVFSPKMISFIYYDVVQPKERSRVYKTVRGGYIWFNYRRLTLRLAQLQNEVGRWAVDKYGEAQNLKDEYEQRIKDDKAIIEKNGKVFSKKVQNIATLITHQIINVLRLKRFNWDLVENALRRYADRSDRKNSNTNIDTEETDEDVDLQGLVNDLKQADDKNENERNFDEERFIKYRMRGTRKNDLQKYIDNLIKVPLTDQEVSWIVAMIEHNYQAKKNEEDYKFLEELLTGSAKEVEEKLEKYRIQHEAKLNASITGCKQAIRYWQKQMSSHLRACKQKIKKNKFFLSRLIELRGMEMSDEEKEKAGAQKEKIDKIIKIFETENAFINDVLFTAVDKDKLDYYVDEEQYDDLSKDAEKLITDEIQQNLLNPENHDDFIQKLEKYKNFAVEYRDVSEDVKKAYDIVVDPTTQTTGEGSTVHYEAYVNDLIELYEKWYMLATAPTHDKKATEEASEAFEMRFLLFIQTIPTNKDYIKELKAFNKALEKGKKPNYVDLIENCKDSMKTLNEEAKGIDAVTANSIISGQNAKAMLDYMQKYSETTINGVLGGEDATVYFMFPVLKRGYLVSSENTDPDSYPNNQLLEYDKNKAYRVSKGFKNLLWEQSDESVRFYDAAQKNLKKEIKSFTDDEKKKLKEARRTAIEESKIDVELLSIGEDKGNNEYTIVFNPSASYTNNNRRGYEGGNDDNAGTATVQGDNTSDFVADDEQKQLYMLAKIHYPRSYKRLNTFFNNQENRKILYQYIFDNLNNALAKTGITCKYLENEEYPFKMFGGSDLRYSDEAFEKEKEKFTDIIKQGTTFRVFDSQTEEEGEWYWLRRKFKNLTEGKKFSYWMLWFFVEKSKGADFDAFCDDVYDHLYSTYVAPVIRNGNYRSINDLVYQFGTAKQKEELNDYIRHEGQNNASEGYDGLVVEHIDLSTEDKAAARNIFVTQTQKNLLIMNEEDHDSVFASTFEKAELIEVKFPLFFYQMHDDIESKNSKIYAQSLLASFGKGKLNLYDPSINTIKVFGDVTGCNYASSPQMTFEEYIKTQYRNKNFSLERYAKIAAKQGYDLEDFRNWNGMSKQEPIPVKAEKAD